MMLVRKSIKVITLSTCCIIASSLAGCTWVKKSPGAERVRVAPIDRVSDCRNLGSVTAYTKDKLSIVNRSSEKVKKELETLAMNDAVERNGDTISPTSRIQDGQQTFTISRCLP